jgi:hypothetical protein
MPGLVDGNVVAVNTITSRRAANKPTAIKGLIEVRLIESIQPISQGETGCGQGDRGDIGPSQTLRPIDGSREIEVARCRDLGG